MTLPPPTAGRSLHPDGEGPRLANGPSRTLVLLDVRVSKTILAFEMAKDICRHTMLRVLEATGEWGVVNGARPGAVVPPQ